MLGLSRKLRYRTAQVLLALVGGLWLVAASAPCVMAMSHCPPGTAGGNAPQMQGAEPGNVSPHCPPGTAGGNAPLDQPGLYAVNDCDVLAALDCKTSGEQRLAATTSAMDFSIVPVRLHSLPVAAAMHTTLVPDRYATVILSPPLNLRHAVLLI